MFAVKALAMFMTIMLSLLGMPLLYGVIFNKDTPSLVMTFMPMAMNLLPILWIGSFFIGIYFAVQLGKHQV